MGMREDNISFLRYAMKNLKEYKTDMAIDLLKIFQERAKRFKKYMSYEEDSSIQRHINDLKDIVIAPRIRNKIYLVSEIERILLIALSISDLEVEKLIEILKPYQDTFDISPDYITTLYIFNKEKIIFRKDLYPGEMNMIIRYFNDVNLNPAYDITTYDRLDELFL